VTPSVPPSATLLPPLSPSASTHEAVDPPPPPSPSPSEVRDEEGWLQIGRHRWPPFRNGSGGDATLIVSLGGPLEGSLGELPLQLSGPKAALFLPDRLAGQVSVKEFNGLLMRLHNSRLKRAAALVSGQNWSPRRFATLLQAAVTVAGEEGDGQRQLQRLGVVARLVDPMAGHPPGEIHLLALDEVLDRLVVLALWGEQLRSETSERGVKEGDREAILDDLVSWIRANSDRPLHMAELEKRSGYSERSLRNAFQERFGCPPKQWIRRTRMEAARQRLLEPGPGETVSTIARDHGYQHVSQFSRDFRCVFGQQPSLVMRQARRTIS